MQTYSTAVGILAATALALAGCLMSDAEARKYLPSDWELQKASMYDCSAAWLEHQRAINNANKFSYTYAQREFDVYVDGDFVNVRDAWGDRALQIAAEMHRRGCYEEDDENNSDDIEHVDEKLDIERDERRHGELLDAIRSRGEE